ncbi:MAG: AEC family transporter [Alphaproteobacteria bacterium]|nr:AEC family transporter [Alphaproteobacteria bacterium]
MIPVLSIVLPVFGLIGLGVVGGRSKLFPEAAVNGLSNFVLYVAVPALLFRTIVRSRPFDALNFDIVFAYYGASFVVMIGALALGRYVFGLRGGERASFAMGSMFSNTTLLGVPLVFGAWGEAGLVPLMVIITLHSLVFSTTFFVLHDMAKSGAVGWMSAVRLAVRSIVTNPVIISIVAGLVWAFLGLGLPGIVSSIVDMLGEATIPAALFALGAALAQFPVAGNVKHAVAMATIKLLVHPLAVFVAANWLFELSALELGVATLTAALPGGLMVFLVAQSYGVYVARAGTSLVLSTAGGMVTLSVLIGFFAR